MRIQLKRFLFWLLVILLGLLALAASFFLQSANSFDQSIYRVLIPTGTSAATIEDILEAKGVLKPRSGFALGAKVLGVTRGLQAGEYEFSPSDTLWSILWKLKVGEVYEPEIPRFDVTFPEGASIYRMGEILRQAGVSDPDRFQGLVKEGITADLRKKHWTLFKFIPSESLEGFLYPDTYKFFENQTVDQIVETMVLRFEEVVLPFWDKAKDDTKYDLFEVLTLASIIEKEAQKPEERAIVSSVYHNRLKKNMYLAACPTIKYALNDPTPKVYTYQLEVDSPYNTYKNKGLPPGPICNPGIESIKAAVYPAETNYFYFVAKKDGSHIFSSTWDEHQKARYKAGLNK